ncbi:SRPBCC family protein [Ramlibacter pallidus]|uniref:SRPBCC family protein n=1 Tax=Ramlibacter pallidus TaxID=2780087 RepID=A0ABR9RZ75_9BURK|nr:SRPBCC family protein [Ramlibacter pallidus]MBE7366545.1 SRPBCC family protein [Ramlibacter pallidus]
MKNTRHSLYAALAACLLAWFPSARAAESIVAVRASVLIQRDQDTVFRYVSDVENDIHWRGGIVSIRRTTPGPARAGARTEETLKAFGQTLVTVTEITEFQPPQRVLSRTVQGPAPVAVERTVAASGEGAVFTYALRSDVGNLPLLAFFRPVVQWYYQRQLEGFLETLRTRLEAGAPAR